MGQLMRDSRIFAATLMVIAAFESALGQNENSKTMAVSAVAEANTRFANDLYSALRKSHPENLICSPLSVSAVLAMLKNGARGDTAQEIQTALYFPNDDKLNLGYKEMLTSLKSNSNYTLDIANNVYSMVGFELNPKYVKALDTYFGVKVEQLDFTQSGPSAQKINNWVERITHDKIKDLISPADLDANTRLVLVNGIYFKGKWAKQFDPEDTMPAKFYITPTNTVNVDMMRITADFPYAEIPELDAQAVSIPYQGDRLSMIIILPKQKNGFAEMEKKLKNYDLSKLPSKMQNEKVNLQMPKFKLESTIELKRPLSDLHMPSMFSEDSADFSGIPKNALANPLYVSKAIQKAFIEVNEEGSEAAAATGVVIQVKSAFPLPSTTVEFVADHPFVSIIYDVENGLHIFWTVIDNPLISEVESRSEPITNDGHGDAQGTTKENGNNGSRGQHGSSGFTTLTLGFMYLIHRAFY